MYAYQSPGGTIWALQTIDTEGNVGTYSQIVIDNDDNILIAYYEEEPKDNPKGFTHLIAPAEVRVPDRTWFNFRMAAEAGIVTAFLDGERITSAAAPC